VFTNGSPAACVARFDKVKQTGTSAFVFLNGTGATTVRWGSAITAGGPLRAGRVPRIRSGR
jgi:hypothetical protein